MILCQRGRVQVLSGGPSGYVERAVPQENFVLILAILAFGMIVGWLAQLVLGHGHPPQCAVPHRWVWWAPSSEGCSPA